MFSQCLLLKQSQPSASSTELRLFGAAGAETLLASVKTTTDLLRFAYRRLQFLKSSRTTFINTSFTLLAPHAPVASAHDNRDDNLPTEPLTGFDSIQPRKWHGQCPYNRGATRPLGSTSGAQTMLRARRPIATMTRMSSLACGFSLRSCRFRWVSVHSSSYVPVDSKRVDEDHA